MKNLFSIWLIVVCLNVYSQENKFLGDWEDLNTIMTITEENDKIIVLDGKARAEAVIKRNKLIITNASENYELRYIEETDQLHGLNSYFTRFLLLDEIIALVSSKEKDSLLLAVELLEELIPKHPNREKFYLLMGNAKYFLNDSLEEAKYYYEKALEISPYYWEGNFNMGCIFLEHGQPDNAIPFFTTALNYNRRGTMESLYNLAESYFKSEQADMAIRYFKHVISVTDDNERKGLCFYKIGLSYGKLKNDLDNAIKHISYAIEIDSSNKVYYEDLGVAFGFKQDYYRALDCFEKGLQVDSTYGKFYYNIAITYDKLDKEDKADEFYQKAEEIDSLLRR